MLGQRLRRWPNIKPAMAQSVMFAGQVDNADGKLLSTQLLQTLLLR